MLDALVRIPPVETGVNNVAGFKVTGIIKRSDFGIGGAYADMLLSDAISLDVNGEIRKH
jgi:polyisoprenoid-binding protein YceI